MTIAKRLMRVPHFTWQQALPYVFIVTGLVGLLASFALTYDKIQVLKNPKYIPNCNINPILSCGSVMKHEQASLLGVPNTIFGLIAFTALIMFGLMMLLNTKLPRWIWRVAQVVATLGVVFMHYLFYQGVYRIQAICPWCFAVWMITIPIFFGVTIYNIREGNLGLARLKGSQHIISFVDRFSNELIVTWYLVIFGILLTHFWYYWSTLL